MSIKLLLLKSGEDVISDVKEMGFQVEEEWEMEDNSIELTVTRWVQ